MNEGVEPLINKLQAIDGDYNLILEELGKGAVKQQDANHVADELKEAMTHVIEKLNELKALIDTNRAVIEGGTEENREHLESTINDIQDIESTIIKDIIGKHKIVLKGFTKDSVPGGAPASGTAGGVPNPLFSSGKALSASGTAGGVPNPLFGSGGGAGSGSGAAAAAAASSGGGGAFGPTRKAGSMRPSLPVGKPRKQVGGRRTRKAKAKGKASGKKTRKGKTRK